MLAALTARMGFSPPRKFLQQVTVVARDFDDVTLPIQAEFGNVLCHRRAGVAQERVRERRKIKILGEQLHRRHDMICKSQHDWQTAMRSGNLGSGLARSAGCSKLFASG